MAIAAWRIAGAQREVLRLYNAQDMIEAIERAGDVVLEAREMTLQQVKAAKPSYTYEYEPRFGKNPAWTPEMFVEAIYKNLGWK